MNQSEDIEKYFEEINKQVSLSYQIAGTARRKGFDPSLEVEIPLANNMAERVEGLISVVAPQIKNSGMVNRILELEKEYGKLDWRVAFKIAEEVSFEKFCKFKDKREAMEVGMRVGLAYVTIGIVASPLEGFVKLEIKKRRDGKDYLALFFSGPIRSAGTTATCVFVAIADYIRRKHGYFEYDPTKEEIKRMSTELYDFHERITNLQYLPSVEEIEFYVEHLPLQIDGDPSEKIEVSNYKHLDRIATNILRNGICLVIGEGLTQKAKKFWNKFSKWNKDFDMGDWKWLEKFIDLQTKIKAKEEIKKDDGEESHQKIKPDYTFIKDIVAGRPVLTHPLRTGGLRLRYGRSRTTGLSSTAIHPATMVVLNDFIAIATQLKVERPGKATTLASCDYIEGPIIKLNNGNVVFLESEEMAKKYVKDIDEILFLGDILICYGDFYDRGHVLVPAGYCEEWWFQQIKKECKDASALSDKTGLNLELCLSIFKNPIKTFVSFDEALITSKSLNIPLHPKYTYHWKDINKEQFVSLANWIKKSAFKDEKLILPIDPNINDMISDKDPKRILELLGVPHLYVNKEYIVVEKDWAKALYCLFKNNKDVLFKEGEEDVLKYINENISDIKIKDKSGTFIGARMGRPEKAKIRKLTGSPQVLFPVGEEGGRLRCFQSALEVGKIKADFPIYVCDKCNKETIFPLCETCGITTTRLYYCRACNQTLKEEVCQKHNKTKEGEDIKCLPYKNREIDIRYYFDKVLAQLKLTEYPDLIKGVRGMSNEDHTPEPLAKGIIRAMYDVYVNKDGTIRYDMSEAAITHFKPKELTTSIERLRKLGYVKDIYENDLVDSEQILEIKPQDVILPQCDGSSEEGADKVLFKVAKFIDSLLEKLYGLEPFYNLASKEDLAGHLIMGLAPHTCAATVGRIIGFSKTQGFYAHPMFHCAMRRDCDGDEACVFLLMDGLLNFSRKYLAAHRGSTQDAPLVLTSRVIPTEVDDMLLNMDTVFEYPLELYEAAEQYKYPGDVKIERMINRINSEKQYEGIGFTHDITDFNQGVTCSAYKSIPSMEDKVMGQLELAEKIRAVDEADVARLVLERHFIRDIKGNLRKFSTQEFRCVKCNEKFRRPSLKGVCTKCGGKIIFTVAEGSVIKYLAPSISLAEKFDIPPYLKQTLELTRMRIESVFGKDEEVQEGLGKWFG